MEFKSSGAMSKNSLTTSLLKSSQGVSRSSISWKTLMSTATLSLCSASDCAVIVDLTLLIG